MILPFDQLCHICIKLGCCFSGMIKARASGSKVYLYFMKKGRQERHRIPRNSFGSFYPQNLVPDPQELGARVLQALPVDQSEIIFIYLWILIF